MIIELSDEQIEQIAMQWLKRRGKNYIATANGSEMDIFIASRYSHENTADLVDEAIKALERVKGLAEIQEKKEGSGQ